MLGATLKYRNPDDFGPFKYPKYMRNFFYDISVDIYGSFIFIGLPYATYYMLQEPKPNYSEYTETNIFYLGLVTSLILAMILGYLQRRELKKNGIKNAKIEA